jgi:2-keto-3-deoxy-L-fuconate dehydrogenase
MQSSGGKPPLRIAHCTLCLIRHLSQGGNVEFANFNAVVSGAGSGIGLATARELSRGGANVFGLDVMEGDMSDVATWIKCDIGDTASVDAAFVELARQISVLDVLVNNAGIGTVGTVETTTDEVWQQILNINVMGIARVTRNALPLLRRSNSASIVNTCSVAATAGIPQRAAYSASKGAVLSLTLAMAADYLEDRIRVNCVNPGTADTPWVQRLLSDAADPEVEREALESRQPQGRLVSAEEIAHSICYLASPLSGSTTGTSLAIDGGMQGLRVRR